MPPKSKFTLDPAFLFALTFNFGHNKSILDKYTYNKNWESLLGGTTNVNGNRY